MGLHVRLFGVLATLLRSASASTRLRASQSHPDGKLKGEMSKLEAKLTPISMTGGGNKTKSTPVHPPGASSKPWRPRPEDYHKCGQVMAAAWKREHQDGCGHDHWVDVLRMRDHAEQCKKLRYGNDYIASYKELLEQLDVWCGKPKCGVQGCVHGICSRSGDFPFEPRCSCQSGWTGPTCNTTACDPMCGKHGTCIKDTCHCLTGWAMKENAKKGDICTEPICKGGCLNGGKCIAPNKCKCAEGWKTEGSAAGCNQPVCDPPCENSAKCTKPNVCECPHQKNKNGTIMVGFSGPACEKGPKYWFGEQCMKCVLAKGHWCLKDGICVKGGAPNKDICPVSTKELHDEYTPTVISVHADPCLPTYRRCAEVAEPLVHWVNHDDKLLGGVCGGAIKGLIKEMKDELPSCKDMMITTMDQYVGYLNVTTKFTEILDAAETKHKKECPTDHPPEAS